MGGPLGEGLVCCGKDGRSTPRQWGQVVLCMTWWLSVGRCVQPHLLAGWRHLNTVVSAVPLPYNLHLDFGIFLVLQESPSTQGFHSWGRKHSVHLLAEMHWAKSLSTTPRSPSSDDSWARVSTARSAEWKSCRLWLRNSNALIWTGWLNSSPQPHPAEQDGWPFCWSRLLCHGDPKVSISSKYDKTPLHFFQYLPLPKEI